MNSDPSDTPPPLHPQDDSAAKAKAQAKAIAGQASQAFQSLDGASKIYLIALAVTALCSLFFGAFKVEADLGKELNEFAKAMGQLAGQTKQSQSTAALVNINFWGSLSFLAAVSGIALVILVKTKLRRVAWTPLAIAGAACLSALCILIVRLRVPGVPSETMGIVKFSINGTLLGFWLPLAGAVTAAAISIRRIVKA